MCTQRDLHSSLIHLPLGHVAAPLEQHVRDVRTVRRRTCKTPPPATLGAATKRARQCARLKRQTANSDADDAPMATEHSNNNTRTLMSLDLLWTPARTLMPLTPLLFLTIPAASRPGLQLCRQQRRSSLATGAGPKGPYTAGTHGHTRRGRATPHSSFSAGPLS